MIRAPMNLDLLGFLREVYIPARLELSAGAVRQIEVAVRQLERFAGSSLGVGDLSEDLLRRFLVDFRRTHAAATTNGRRRDLLALWQCAWDLEMVDRPPRRGSIRRAKEGSRVPAAWSARQVAAVIEASQSDPWPIGELPAAAFWRSLLLVLYDTGARVGEALAVESADLSVAGRWVVFRTTKTSRERWAAIAADTAAACARIWDPGRRLVWPCPLSRIQLDRRFARIVRAAGVPRRRGELFRMLRRTSGTLVEAAGGDGARHLGNTRGVFMRNYFDPRFGESQLGLLPRPR